MPRRQLPGKRLKASATVSDLVFLLVLSVSFFLWSSPAVAQRPRGPGLPQPQLRVVTPCGGKLGTTFEVSVNGVDLEEPEALVFSHPGIKAELLKPPAPPLHASKRVKKSKPRREPARQLLRKFKVTIAPATPLGIHDVRLVNKWGVSNPRAFVVGDLAEVTEKEPNNDVAQAQRVALNTTVNGVISAPTDVDYYVFFGRKGRRVVISCLASSIDSRLHAALELYDSAGKWLGENRNYSGNDALLDCTLPADGDYYIRLFQFTYMQGGPEYFYRLTVSTAPWIDAIFPPMVEPGKPANLTVFGRNLPEGKPDPTALMDGRILERMTVIVNVPADAAARQRLAYSGAVFPPSSGLDGFEYRVHNSVGASNPFLLTFATAPVVLANGSHDTPEKALEIPVPCEIAGRIDKRFARDWYTFTAQKGEVCNIETFADRLGFPADLYFVLRNAATKQVMGEFDDNNETLAPVKFLTRTEDPPRYRLVVPADGAYQLLVSSRDADTRAGPRQLYRVRITPDHPDFRLIVMPASSHQPDACIVRQGGNQNFDVFVWRRDGWNGAVSLSAEGLPPGVTCPPQVVGMGLKQTALVVSAAKDAAPWTGQIRIKGMAVIGGQTLMREARPASITWPLMQQNIPTVSRLDRSLFLAVRDKAPFNLTASIDKPAVVQGSKATITLKLARLWPTFKSPLQVSLIATPANLVLPAGLTVNGNQPLNIAAGKNEAKLVVGIRSNVAPGTYNIVLRGQGQVPFNKDEKAKSKPNKTIVEPSTPITLTVLPKQLAKLRLASNQVQVKAGMQAEVLIQVSRLYDFTGEFKVRLVVPPQVKGITAAAVTIPPGKNEAKLILKVAADVAPGQRSNLIVRAIAFLDSKVPISQEAKMNVIVVKPSSVEKPKFR